jgi:hypothetical protein
MAAAAEPSGVLVVRAWFDGDPPQLKARITRTLLFGEPHSETATASNAPAIHAEVDRWLEALKDSTGR